jgi:hypothetical protein
LQIKCNVQVTDLLQLADDLLSVFDKRSKISGPHLDARDVAMVPNPKLPNPEPANRRLGTLDPAQKLRADWRTVGDP